MGNISIKNFGPIKNIFLSLDKPYTILIGAQATGKSTIAKTVYFCKKIRDYLVDFLLDSKNFNTHPNELFVAFLKYIRKIFMAYFGTTKHLEIFEIKYFYEEQSNTSVTLSLSSDGYAKVNFSESLKESIKTLIKEANEIYKNINPSEKLSFLDRYKQESQLLSLYRKHFIEKANDIFYDDSDIIYIPAGRSILSTFSEQLYNVDVTNMDFTMQEFINIIRTTRTKFNMPMQEIVENYTKTIKGQINNNNVNIAIETIKKILKGNYVSGKDGEKIYFNIDKWVKLMFASSGQQESLWTLMLMFSYILENKKAFVVLEEPEAHLFPEAQKNIIELIALFCNSTNSTIVITTHSPYILTSMNLLIHSYIVESNKKILPEEKIINKICRINPTSLQCNLIQSTTTNNIKSIIDKDTGFIDAYEIDTVSNIINDETERLLALEKKYDL